MKGTAYFTTPVALPRGVYCHYSLVWKLGGFQGFGVRWNSKLWVDGTSLLSATVAEFYFEAGRWQIEIGIRYGERNKFRGPESRERGLWHCDNCRHCILVMSYASSYSSYFLYLFFHFLHFPYLLSTVSISSIYSSTYFPSTLSPTSSISSSHHQFFSHLLLPHPSCFFFYPSAYLSSLPQVRNVAALLVRGGDTRPHTLSLCCVEQRHFKMQRIGGVAAEYGIRCQYSETKCN